MRVILKGERTYAASLFVKKPTLHGPLFSFFGKIKKAQKGNPCTKQKGAVDRDRSFLRAVLRMQIKNRIKV